MRCYTAWFERTWAAVLDGHSPRGAYLRQVAGSAYQGLDPADQGLDLAESTPSVGIVRVAA